MSVDLVTAVRDPRWEADVVAGLGREETVRVVRRCVDLADTLATAAAGVGRVVLLSADLPGLDRDALTRLAVAGVGVVGLTAPGDEAAERLLRQLGVAQVVAADHSADVVAAAVLAAAGAAAEAGRFDYADPRDALPHPAYPSEGEGAADGADRAEAAGRLVAVWGPTGAPGRTSVAVGVAAELAELGVAALLVDADVFGGSVAQVLGLLDESPGVAAACRLANSATLDLAGLAELAVEVRPHLRVLTGISRAERWPELRPSALSAVLGLARDLAEVVVVDCGFCLERDEELSYDTVAPRRNGATLAVLDGADVVVAVAAGDPVGLQRFVRGLADLREAVPGCSPVTVVTRVRAAAVGGGDAQAEITAALTRYAGVTDLRFVPLDQSGYDRALATGRTLPEVAPASPARLALRAVAAGLLGRPAPARRRRLRRRQLRPASS